MSELLAKYWQTMLFSLPYFVILGLVGSLIILKRESLLGVLIGKVAQLAFIIVASVGTIAGIFTHDAFIAGNSPLLADLLILGISVSLILLIAALLPQRSEAREAVFAILFVVFIALGHFSNDLLSGTATFLHSTYFTEILYTPVENLTSNLLWLLLILILFVTGLGDFIFTIFDRDQAFLLLGRFRIRLIDIALYSLIALTVVIAIRVMGVYLAIMALLVPGLVAVRLGNSIRAFWGHVIGFSVCAHFLSFSAALFLKNRETSPTMIVSWAIFALFYLSFFRLIRILGSGNGDPVANGKDAKV